MNNLKKIAAGITTAAVLGYGATASAMLPTPSAVADAYLQVNNFTLFAGNSAAGRNFDPIMFSHILPIGAIGSGAGVEIDVSNSGDTSATLNGITNGSSVGPLGVGLPFTLEDSVGAGFTAGTTLPVGTLNAGSTYAGSHSSTDGNALTGEPNPNDPGMPSTSICGAAHVIGDCVLTHNQINLDGGGVGSAFSNNTLESTFIVNVNQAQGQLFEMFFDASLFLRTGLGQDDVTSSVTSTWRATVIDTANPNDPILSWEPGGSTPFGAVLADVPGLRMNNLLVGQEGTCVAAGTCVEYSDEVDLNDGFNTNSQNDFDQSGSGTESGLFEIELFLAEGTYEFSIFHFTRADATVIVPEPGTLALMSLGFLGAGVARRRMKK